MPISSDSPRPAAPIALVGARVLDTDANVLGGPAVVVLRDGLIDEVREGAASAPAGTDAVDVTGRVLMPGLIDAHVHVTQAGTHAEIHDWDSSYHVARSAQEMEHMLRRGFTTVRDMGGAETGLARAVEERLFTGPRLLAGGPIFSPTGGHGLTHTVDGEVELRKALRSQFRDGADHIKLTVSGGVIAKMRIEALGFSEQELRAAVDEARLAKRYIGAHAYTAEAVNRALSLGVRTIEHGTYLDDESIRLLTELEDVHLVPTLVALWGMLQGESRGTIGEDARQSVQDLFEVGLETLKTADSAGVSIGFGTDLHGSGQRLQLEEIRIRARVQTPEAILRSLTISGADIVRRADRIGRVVPGYDADLLLVDTDPRVDLDAIADATRSRLVVTAGEILD